METAKKQPKSPQQWEMLASPGHVLLAQVDVLRHKSRAAIAIGAFGLVLLIAAVWLAPRLGAGAGKLAGWITSGVETMTAKAGPVADPVKAPRMIRASFAPGARFDPAQVATLQEVGQAMDAQIAELKAGKGVMEGCDTTKKITDPWAGENDTVPRCRLSADKSRLWVWGIAKPDNYRIAPILGVIRVNEATKTHEFVNVDLAGVARLPGKTGIDPLLIPRAIRADFQELSQ